MRLWHKYMIKVLPRQQLVSQWRECCCIAHNLIYNDTPNHILVNKIVTYPIDHFISYTRLVIKEMKARGYTVNEAAFFKYFDPKPTYSDIFESDIFKDWHNNRYYSQCFFNLQEKYDCGGIPEDEWRKVCDWSRLQYPAHSRRFWR